MSVLGVQGTRGSCPNANASNALSCEDITSESQEGMEGEAVEVKENVVKSCVAIPD